LAAVAEPSQDDLPDTVSLTQAEIDLYFPLWRLWRATGKRFLPSQLMGEPAEPLAALLEMESYFQMIASPDDPDLDNASSESQ
jgi:hypothetical protein